jgi:diacylglycerol kinase (ATP)
MKVHAKVIVNPAAGKNTTYRRWPGIRSLLKTSGLSFDYQFTEARGHGIELAKEAASNGYRYLVSVGGDGTVHEVANGILQTENSSNTDLGIVSTGTGSDLARSIGVSRDYRRACSNLINFKSATVDAGLVEYRQNGLKKERYFVNSAGIGFDATVVEATERLPKYFGGTVPYIVGLLRSFLGYRNKPVILRLGNKAKKACVLSIVVANGRYFGGGMHIAPEARLDDGLLDIIVVGNIGKLELLKTFPRVYKGTHMTHPKISHMKAAQIAIESDQKFLLHADGELLGEGPVSFSLVPACLKLVT